MKLPNPKILGTAVFTLAVLIAVAYVMWIMPFRETSAYKKLPAPPNEVSIMAFGDQGSADYRQRRVAALLEAKCRDLPSLAFVQTLGDNFYFRGVQSTSDVLWDKALQDMYDTPCLSQIPFHAVVGNHDEEGDPKVLVAYGKGDDEPIKWYMPNTYYATRFGKTDSGESLATLVVVDTNVPLAPQIALIDKTFANAGDTVWRIVAGHHDIRTDSVKYHDDDRLFRELLPALVRNHVHFYVAGHSHNLQLIEQAAEPVYVIAGGGGKRPRPILKSNTGNNLIFARQALGFVTMTFEPTRATIQFTATSGFLFTTFASHEYTYQVALACMQKAHHDHCVKAVN